MAKPHTLLPRMRCQGVPGEMQSENPSQIMFGMSSLSFVPCR